MDWEDLYEEERDPDNLSVREDGRLVLFHEVEQASASSSSRAETGFFFPLIDIPLTRKSPPLVEVEGWLAFSRAMDAFERPMNPETTFPMEFESDVGGVLIILLVPALEFSSAEFSDDDDEDVEGEMWSGHDLPVGSGAGASAESLAPLTPPDPKLFAVPLAEMVLVVLEACK
jgi:hypothetical protein